MRRAISEPTSQVLATLEKTGFYDYEKPRSCIVPRQGQSIDEAQSYFFEWPRSIHDYLWINFNHFNATILVFLRLTNGAWAVFCARIEAIEFEIDQSWGGMDLWENEVFVCTFQVFLVYEDLETAMVPSLSAIQQKDFFGNTRELWPEELQMETKIKLTSVHSCLVGLQAQNVEQTDRIRRLLDHGYGKYAIKKICLDPFEDRRLSALEEAEKKYCF